MSTRIDLALRNYDRAVAQFRAQERSRMIRDGATEEELQAWQQLCAPHDAATRQNLKAFLEVIAQVLDEHTPALPNSAARALEAAQRTRAEQTLYLLDRES